MHMKAWSTGKTVAIFYGVSVAVNIIMATTAVAITTIVVIAFIACLNLRYILDSFDYPSL